MKKLYKVKAKCGHVGRYNYIIKEFPIIAESMKEAASICRNKPRVKHHHKDAIISVDEITAHSYTELHNRNQQDPYFNASNIQEQRLTYDYYSQVQRDETEEVDPFIRKEKVNYLQRKRRLIERQSVCY